MTKTFPSFLRPTVFSIAVLGIAYSLIVANYHHLSTLLMLLPLLAIVEWFPNRIGRVEYLGSFPILYTMAITAGYQATAVFSVGLLAISYALHRKSLRNIITACSIRSIALVITGFATYAIQASLPILPSAFFMYFFLNLFLSVFFFTLVTHLMFLAAAYADKLDKVAWISIAKACLLDIGLALVYDGFMIWLAYNPKNTASGPLGTLFFFLPLPAMMIVLHLIGNLTRAKKRLEALFAVSQSMHQEREQRLILEERNRLAREIHDGLAQNLAGTIYQIELLRRRRGEHLESALNDLQNDLLATVATVRESIYALRPHSSAHLGLVPAIRAHLHEIQTQYGLATRFETSLDELPCSTDVREVVFSVVSESIQNVVKHSSASEVVVKIGKVDDAVQVTIADNGFGFEFGAAVLSASHRHSFGIENMYQLAGSIDAALDIRTAPGEGTVVSLEISVAKEAANDNPRALV